MRGGYEPKKSSRPHGPTDQAIDKAIDAIVVAAGKRTQEEDLELAAAILAKELENWPGITPAWAKALDPLSPIMVLPGWTPEVYRAHCREVLAGLLSGRYLSQSTPVTDCQVLLILEALGRKTALGGAEACAAERCRANAYGEGEQRGSWSLYYWTTAGPILARVSRRLTFRQIVRIYSLRRRGLTLWGKPEEKRK